jgi:hypothetical protein
MMRLPARLLVGGLLSFLLDSPLSAHDYWLELSSWAPAPGESVVVTHLVGERLAGETVGRNPAAIVRFGAVEAEGASRPVTLEPVAHRAGRFVARGAGATRIVYQSLPAFATLSPATFDRYLAEERLDSIRALRGKLGEVERPAREAFSRSAIAVACGPGKGSPAVPPWHPVGLELEIVAESDPCGAAPGRELAFRLLRDGRPAAGVVMRALARGRPDPPLEAVSDAEGRFRFRFDAPGLWLIKGVAMERAAGLAEAEWRSRWASLTFELAAGGV